MEQCTNRGAVLRAVPPGRGGAVAALLSPYEAIVLCGSDHSDGDEMLAPHVLKLVLPP